MSVKTLEINGEPVTEFKAWQYNGRWLITERDGQLGYALNSIHINSDGSVTLKFVEAYFSVADCIQAARACGSDVAEEGMNVW